MPPFDVDALRRIAGEKVFTRGASYYAAGQVEIVAIDGERIIAQVHGSDLYRVELIAGDREISGYCSCPAFADWGFCKHLVATALSANSLALKERNLASSRLRRIRAQLHAQGTEPLLEIIMRLAEHDTALLRALAAWAEEKDDEVLRLARSNNGSGGSRAGKVKGRGRTPARRRSPQ